MIFTFFKAQGLNVGSSLVEEDKLDLARQLMKTAKAKGVDFYLPVDVVIADRFDADAESRVVAVTDIPDGWMGLDVGPTSISQIQSLLGDCQTVIWNGPMGVFEMAKFAAGTMAVAETLATLTEAGATTIIGGGDSVAAVEKAGVAGEWAFGVGWVVLLHVLVEELFQGVVGSQTPPPLPTLQKR